MSRFTQEQVDTAIAEFIAKPLDIQEIELRTDKLVIMKLQEADGGTVQNTNDANIATE